jgi:hypothetical protein
MDFMPSSTHIFKSFPRNGKEYIYIEKLVLEETGQSESIFLIMFDKLCKKSILFMFQSFDMEIKNQTKVRLKSTSRFFDTITGFQRAGELLDSLKDLCFKFLS